jgi:hypothetical protein
VKIAIRCQKGWEFELRFYDGTLDDKPVHAVQQEIDGWPAF